MRSALKGASTWVANISSCPSADRVRSSGMTPALFTSTSRRGTPWANLLGEARSAFRSLTSQLAGRTSARRHRRGDPLDRRRARALLIPSQGMYGGAKPREPLRGCQAQAGCCAGDEHGGAVHPGGSAGQPGRRPRASSPTFPYPRAMLRSSTVSTTPAIIAVLDNSQRIVQQLPDPLPVCGRKGVAGVTSILWLRRDLRIHDHPALEAARRAPTISCPCSASTTALLHGRHALRAAHAVPARVPGGPRSSSLRARGSRLVIRHGRARARARRAGRRDRCRRASTSAPTSSPFARARDERVRVSAQALGVDVHAHPGLFAVDDLGAIRTQAARRTRCSRRSTAPGCGRRAGTVLARPRSLPPLPPGLVPGRASSTQRARAEQELEDPPPGGEPEGSRRLARFLADGVAAYADGPRRCSARTAPRASRPTCTSAACRRARLEAARPAARGRGVSPPARAGATSTHHVLRHFPRNAHSEHQARYRGTIRWSRAESASRRGARAARAIRSWTPACASSGARAGCTTARGSSSRSFLTKDLGIDWRWGERWFMRLLLDGDEASNNGNWQWIASVGVDPQPPSAGCSTRPASRPGSTPTAAYVHRYVPDLHDTSGYVKPIVDHAAARREALERYRI